MDHGKIETQGSSSTEGDQRVGSGERGAWEYATGLHKGLRMFALANRMSYHVVSVSDDRANDDEE